MTKKRRWLWSLLFISAALLLGGLATGWNIVLVKDYQSILALAKTLSLPPEISIHSTSLIMKMILGTLGFVAVLTFTLLLFVKLLSEMRLNQFQSEFLATVTHELKTPIAAVKLSASLIKAGGLSKSEIDRLWASHEAELERLREEVEALLEAAHWQTKPTLTQKKEFLMETWLYQSFKPWKSILGPDAELIREGDSMNFHIDVDLRTLNLIVNNLLNNAKKFSRGAPHVILRTRRLPARYFLGKPRWQLEFEDHGWGFNAADSKKIFHRFFRSHNYAPYAIPGTGLGLYLASAASRALRLSLKANNKSGGQGAVFTLEGQEDLK